MLCLMNVKCSIQVFIENQTWIKSDRKGYSTFQFSFGVNCIRMMMYVDAVPKIYRKRSAILKLRTNERLLRTNRKYQRVVEVEEPVSGEPHLLMHQLQRETFKQAVPLVPCRVIDAAMQNRSRLVRLK